jgi:cytochrome c551/c552
VVDGLREGYIHDIKPEGVRAEKGNLPLLHPQAFYTLNAIPQGAKADITLVNATVKNVEMIDKGTLANTPDNQMKEARPNTEGVAKKDKTKPKTTATMPKPAPVVATINEKEIQGLLAKYTCNACHKASDRAVGPAYSDIAKRKYSVAKVVQLVAEPKPQNWPDFATPMAPMPQVPKADVEKIAGWINSLKK